MKLPVSLGTYQLTRINVEVILIKGLSSYCETKPSNKAHPRIAIGIDSPEWWMVLEAVIHEAMEFCLLQMGHTYVPEAVCTRNSTTYHFHFDHGQFVLVTEDVAYFMSDVLPKIEKRYKQYQKEITK